MSKKAVKKKVHEAEKVMNEVLARRVRNEYFRVDRLVWYQADSEDNIPRFKLATRRDVFDKGELVSQVYVDCATKRVLPTAYLKNTKALGRRVVTKDRESGERRVSFIFADMHMVSLGAVTQFTESHTTQKGREAERVAKKAFSKAAAFNMPTTVFDVDKSGRMAKVLGVNRDVVTSNIHEKISKSTNGVRVSRDADYVFSIDSKISADCDQNKAYSDLSLSLNFIVEIEAEMNLNIGKACERIDPTTRFTMTHTPMTSVVFDHKADFCDKVAENTFGDIEFDEFLDKE